MLSVSYGFVFQPRVTSVKFGEPPVASSRQEPGPIPVPSQRAPISPGQRSSVAGTAQLESAQLDKMIAEEVCLIHSNNS